MGREINVELHMKCEANVNVKDVRDLHAPLVVVAGYTLSREQLELILDHGRDIGEIDDEGTTVLISAAFSGDIEGLEMLLAKGANIHAASTTLGTASEQAATFEGNEECLGVLLHRDGDAGQGCGTALQAAADAEDLDCINVLLEADADVNEGESKNWYPLRASASSENIAYLRRLLEAGANVNVVGNGAGFALAKAASTGHVECLGPVLEHGADVNMHSGTHQYPL